MARWLVDASAAEGVVALGPPPQSWVVLLSTVIVFYICVSTLVGLCAVRSNSQADVHDLRFGHQGGDHRSSARGEPEGDLAMESRTLSHRFSSTSTTVITKLGASFRISGSFRSLGPSSSFRMSSSLTDCRTQVDVTDALRRAQRPEADEMTTSEPAVWQRVILRGERCAPLSFSGLVLYDEHGNPLPSHDTATEQSPGSPNSEQYNSSVANSSTEIGDAFY